MGWLSSPLSHALSCRHHQNKHDPGGLCSGPQASEWHTSEQWAHKASGRTGRLCGGSSRNVCTLLLGAMLKVRVCVGSGVRFECCRVLAVRLSYGAMMLVAGVVFIILCSFSVPVVGVIP
jgi:hypothetical protein